ncbi:MAG TPA: hypothetical protein VFW87_12445 [Pirellulales bacterium]|nr:hypothetical protein [Pirellulales bacterium]
MTTFSPATAEWARRLLAFEASRGASCDAHADQAIRVCEGLRAPLSKLAGPASYRALVSRALALAKAEAPALGLLRVGADDQLEGFEQLEQHPDAGVAEQGGVALVAHLLGLLVTLIGEPLTLSLVHGAWPDAALAGINSQIEAKS